MVDSSAPRLPSRQQRARAALTPALLICLILRLGAGLLEAWCPPAPLCPPRRLHVRLSQAPAWQLRLLPGVGTVRARVLIDARQATGPWRTWADVDAVAGFGPARLAALRALEGVRP